MSDVKVGDRVRLENKNGDVAEFKVTLVRSGSLESETNFYPLADGWSLAEILPPALPNEDGIFLPIVYDGRAVKYPNIFARTKGVWYNVGNTFSDVPRRILDEEIAKYAGRLTRLVPEEFNGA